MIIEFGAFQNCLSLKEIHFEKCTEAVNTDIYKCNIPDNMKIIVHDKMYQKFFNTEIPANRYRLQLYSDYIQEQIVDVKYSNIIISIIYLDDIINILKIGNYQLIIDTILKIREYLVNTYNIIDANINYIRYRLNKKQEIQNES